MTMRIVLIAGMVGIAGFATIMVGVISGILALDVALVGIAASLGLYVGALAVGALVARLPKRLPHNELAAARAVPSAPPRRWEPQGAVLH